MSATAYLGGMALIDGRLERLDVVTRGDRIVALAPDALAPDALAPAALAPDVGLDGIESVDCTARIITPGFIDLQCNGAVGVDLTGDPDGIGDVASALPQFGVTSFLPTVVTSPGSNRARAIESIQLVRDRAAASASADPNDGPSVAAVPLGLHFEGPMISVEHLGAHRRDHVEVVGADEVGQWQRSSAVAMVTLAPEVPGALGVVDQLARAGIVVSAGHTAMTPAVFTSARTGGLGYVTHLFNAMAPFSHRAPGPIGAVLADADVMVGLICDGIHVDPTAIRLAWRSLGPHRTTLVSDASAALGLPYGRFRLGRVEIVHDATGVRTTAGVLAGSALALDQAVRNLVDFTGCDLAAALATVTSTPADVLGLTDRGRLSVGARADLNVLTERGDLVATVVGGRRWSASAGDLDRVALSRPTPHRYVRR